MSTPNGHLTWTGTNLKANRLHSKVSLVTGSGSGIGRAIAILFAREGAKVVVVDLVRSGGEETVRFIEELGGTACFVKADVSRENEVAEMARKAVKRYGRLDILVNSAGTLKGLPCNTEELAEEDWEKIIAVNLKGAFLCAKHLIRQMKKQGNGAIINVASEASRFGLARWQAYCASKGGLVALTKSLALELAPTIRVNSISPGTTRTPLSLPTLRTKEERQWFIGDRIPLKRMAEPSEIAPAALWLASDEASFITGADLAVDGGTCASGPGRVK